MSRKYVTLTYEHAQMIKEALETSKPIPSAGMLERLDRHAKALLAVNGALTDAITFYREVPNPH